MTETYILVFPNKAILRLTASREPGRIHFQYDGSKKQPADLPEWLLLIKRFRQESTQDFYKKHLHAGDEIIEDWGLIEE